MISRLTTVVFAIALSASLIHSCNAGESPGRTRSKSRMSKKQIETQEQRDRTTESNPGEKKPGVKAKLAKKPAARYQMLSAGERVVVLDTHTGKTQIIEPKMRPTYQNVEVGRAWVVVTVLGNLSERSNLSDSDNE